jgi:hypothetical protein
VLDNWHFWPRNIAADKSRNGPHHYGHRDDDGGENEYALQYRRVQPNAVVVVFVVIVVVAHRSRLILPRGVFQQFRIAVRQGRQSGAASAACHPGTR